MEIINKMIDSGFYGIKFGFNNGASVTVPKALNAIVRITDVDTCTVLCEVDVQKALNTLPDDDVKNELTITTDKKYYINYLIEVESEDVRWAHQIDLKNKVVLFRLGDDVIGDNLAWLPYVDEFQKKHQCIAYCQVFKEIAEIVDFPNIKFIGFDEDVESYATYNVGFFTPCKDRRFQPVDPRHVGLQRIAAYELGLEPIERRTILKPTKERQIKEKYVCIATQASTQCKCWNNPNGWIGVVKYLKSLGYRVLCIDKNSVYSVGRFSSQIPYGCEDFTGNIPLIERVNLLAYADFFVGLPSGLSWMAYSVGIPTVMISGFSLPSMEFYTPYRVINYNGCNGCFSYEDFDPNDYGFCPLHKGTEQEFECTRIITPEYVIKYIDKLISDNHLL